MGNNKSKSELNKKTKNLDDQIALSLPASVENFTDLYSIIKTIGIRRKIDHYNILMNSFVKKKKVMERTGKYIWQLK